ncbi:MAG TPA: DNA-3-methyladenine glycosylase [Actinomycetota bacterium]|nr:DNA-3-methyladenine glycosylase [Actinomycetota bacterium]
MRFGPRLPRRFFARPATVVAPDLLGRVLVRMLPDGTRVSVRLVEVEAYGPDDPASHAFRGRTARNAVMFGPPGHLYVYFTYGMHFCANVVTGTAGVGSAVLLRAAEPLEGLETMSARRGVEAPRLLCSGPGRLAQAMGVDRRDDGADLVGGANLELRAGEPLPASRVARSARVGVRVGVRERWRYFERGSPFLSPGRPASAVTGSRGS